MEVLDHGYVQLVEHWGSDERIIEAARMSTNKGFLGWGDGEKPGDEKLLKYLWDHRHTTPFEMAGMTLEIQAPILVFREWHRHRTQSYNEMSSRYTPLPNVNYLPTVERVMRNAGGGNKQAGTVAGADELTATVTERLLFEEGALLKQIEDLYQRKLKAGFPKELARTHLNVSRYSRMRASGNLWNWLRFLGLRDEPSAQWEIQEYARAVASYVRMNFPRTYALYQEGKTK